jgi:threonine 3-dehydrogenase
VRATYFTSRSLADRFCVGFSTVRALVKAEAAPGLLLTDVPEPEPGSGDVLIAVTRAGICGTDVHIEKWDAWASRAIEPPLVIGHEFVGEVVEVGSNVTGFGAGDIVSGEGHLVCGRCRNCMAGRRHLCAHSRGVGVNAPGAFAERIVLPMTNVWKHDDAIDLDVAAIFDPFGNATHCALSFPVLGEDVLITGAGPIGLMATAVVRHAGARHVVVTDLNEYRLEIAGRMGAGAAVDPRTEPLEQVQRRLDMQEGFDVGLEMSGSPEALKDMLANMAHGGKIALLGIPPHQVAIDWDQVIFNMLTIKGIYGREMYETWYAMTVMLQSGLDIRPVISHRYSFEDHEEAFRTAAGGEAAKVLLEWDA